MSSSLHIRDVDMRFDTSSGPYEALRGVQLDIEAGEFVCLIGHSGCGKSTLLNLIAGLLRPSGGELRCDDDLITGAGPERAVVFQQHALLPWMNCAENVMLGVKRVFGNKESPAQLTQRVTAALEMVHLAHAARKMPYEISGGMKQRVGIARALAIEPRVLLMDEPFGALDELTRAALQDEVMRISAEMKPTVVMVTHDIDEAILLSDRIVMMSNGPSAHVAEILQIAFPRPRDRLALASDAQYAAYRRAMMEFLYLKQVKHVE
ncbi:ABC transporter ATP-binding protein [Massilia sp. W12]|uniref:ABC transporter ATP-binding protein n=1 Tax=Massilia sp. W12 TaxID=3126507 RepID=UPI0030D39EFD